ncbi:MAG: hypothetical protein QNJ41_29610 [Xenococcaceae cyanobacterium MO_188.B32]|nr:hypothetical protein [Xenococcaceae cyanobacterium MO_188.B32]
MNKKLISEQLPYDGSFQMHKILESANERLGKLGKHGKRCKLKLASNKVVLQFSFESKQRQKSNDWSFTRQGISEAEKIATMVTSQLTANQFSMEWLDSLLGKKKTTANKKELTCAEMIAEYKEYWLKENKSLKRPETAWYSRFIHVEKIFSQSNKPLSIQTMRQAIEATDKNTFTRTFTLQALRLLLDYFSVTNFDKEIHAWKSQNKPKYRHKYIPCDEEIMTIYNLAFKPKISGRKDYLYRLPQWQFLYGLLATYGLRVHEAWNIANWDKPVILRDKDWIEIGLENESGKEDTFISRYKGSQDVIPAMTDPDNNLHLLAIKHDTKTGYRMAMPLSPIGHDWLKEFELVGALRLPDIENPLGYSTDKAGTCNCTDKTGRWFRRQRYGFTPHALRHAYNHRAHQQNLNPKLIASVLGHSMQMNQTTYLNSMPTSRNVQMIKQTISEVQNNQSELKKLKIENEHLKIENEKLRTELKLHEALKDK